MIEASEDPSNSQVPVGCFLVWRGFRKGTLCVHSRFQSNANCSTVAEGLRDLECRHGEALAKEMGGYMDGIKWKLLTNSRGCGKLNLGLGTDLFPGREHVHKPLFIL